MNEQRRNEKQPAQSGASETARAAAEDPTGKAEPRLSQGARIKRARAATLTLVFVAVIASLAFDSGIGTPSAFGIGSFSLLCPLGGLEALLASKALIPVALISAGVVVLFALLFGRAWCAWGCPAPVVRKLFGRKERRSDAAEGRASRGDESGDATPAAGRSCATCGAVQAKGALASLVADRRTWALAVVLVAALVASFPLFCLVCPVGLTFGTVGSLWHLIVDKQMTLSVLVFPLALMVELVLYRRWCTNLCPIAGLLNLFGHAARTFRPRADASTCLQATGAACHACTAVCPESIDLHAPDATEQLARCTRCGECAAVCPTASIAIKLLPERSEKGEARNALAEDGSSPEAAI